jgi:hypothetical protein
MQSEKKQLEIALMHYFRDCYPDFPKGKMTPSESPDFIVTLKSRNALGIELTRLNPINAQTPDKQELTQQKSEEDIIETARQIFESNSPFRLFVKFLFSGNETIEDDRKLILAVQLANIIRQSVENKTTASFFRKTLDSGSLPRGIESILIVNHPALNNSFWERSNNLGVSKNVVADIRETIQKKDKKLMLYQKQRLNYYWLLITTDRLRGVKSYNLHNKILNHNFQSRFQRVFLFDLIKSNIFELV